MGHNNSPTSILIVKIGVDYTKFHPIVNLISTLNIVLKVLIVFLEDWRGCIIFLWHFWCQARTIVLFLKCWWEVSWQAKLRRKSQVLDPHYFHPTRQLEWPTLLISTLIRCRFESVTVFGAFFLLVLCEHMELNLILMCPYCSSTFNCHSLPPVIVRVNIQPSFRIPLRAKWSEDTEEPWALTCTSYPWEAQFSHTE